MPKHTQRIIAVPMGTFRADPILGRATKKEGPARGYSAKEQDRRIRELVARKRAEEQR
jgi:hypothetical protein